MGKQKAMKGGDFKELPVIQTKESKTTIDNSEYRNTLIDNQNSVNSSNLTQINSQSLQKGGAAGVGNQRHQEHYYPDFGSNSDVAMSAINSNNQLKAHAVNDDAAGKILNKDGSTVSADKQYGPPGSVYGGGRKRKSKRRKTKRKSKRRKTKRKSKRRKTKSKSKRRKRRKIKRKK